MLLFFPLPTKRKAAKIKGKEGKLRFVVIPSPVIVDHVLVGAKEEEQKQIRADIAKYAGLAAKSGIKSVLDTVNDLIEELPSLLDDFLDFLKDLGSGKDEE